MNLYQLLRKIYGVLLASYRLLFLYPRKTISFEGVDYDAYWLKRGKGEVRPITSWQKARADLAANIIRSQGGENLELADIGGGNGAVAGYLRSVVPNITGCVVYDNSPLILEVARRSGVEAIQLDVQSSNVESQINLCDYVLLFEIIEHVPHSEKLVEAALKKARRGIFISIPNTGFLPYRLRLLMGKAPAQWINYPNEHVRFWTMRDMHWWLEALGLAPQAHVRGYRGIPLLATVWPSVFAAGLFIWIDADGVRRGVKKDM